MEAPCAGIVAALGAGARNVRRGLLVAALAALGPTALAAPAALASFTPEAGTYIDHSTSNGHRLTFHYAAHTGTVHDFTLSSNTIFSAATVHHTTEGWRFTHYDSHHIVHGTWLNHYTVHGSICNLHIDPTGCRSTTSGKQFFEAVFPHGKPPEGPWTGTSTNLLGARNGHLHDRPVELGRRQDRGQGPLHAQLQLRRLRSAREEMSSRASGTTSATTA